MSEQQLTFTARNHQLTNAQIWSADSLWLVFDVRTDQTQFNGKTIERVNIEDGRVEVLYEAAQGAYVGVATVDTSSKDRYICIHSPENPDAQWYYTFHYRRGVILSAKWAENLEGFDFTPPFTVGALRGGTHVHQFSPDGRRISFTYNDYLMHQLSAEHDQRNVGVAIDTGPVVVSKTHPREYSGSQFCVLVTHTTIKPQPGSDQISRAYEEAWVGKKGYLKADGTRQRYALAFIGDVILPNGAKAAEVFIVDLPEDAAAFHVAGEAPLTGTLESLPAPPKGVQQRRLTYGTGIAVAPRHWLRSSPDGAAIGFLQEDNQQIIQIWQISPLGGKARQLTSLAYSVQSVFSWHPSGKYLAFICDNSVMLWDIERAIAKRLTTRTSPAPCAEAFEWSPDGKKIAFMREISGWRQVFMVTVDLSKLNPQR
jgi:Tol biopolymer transport system component